MESTRTLAALKIRNCDLDSGTRKELVRATVKVAIAEPREGTRASARAFSNDFEAHAGLPPCTQEGETIRGVLLLPSLKPRTMRGVLLEGGVGLQHKTKNHDREGVVQSDSVMILYTHLLHSLH